MVKQCYYPNTGIRLIKPYVMSRVEVDTGETDNVDMPVYVYIGNGLDSEYFDNYCISNLSAEEYNIDEFVTINKSPEDLVILICLPRAFMVFKEFVSDICLRAITYYNSLLYYIVEFDSFDNTKRCLQHIPKKSREMKYDDKRRKFYIKIYPSDGLSAFEFGDMSMIPDIRFDTLKNISGVFSDA